MKGRSIQDTIWTIHCLMERVEREESEGFMLTAIDQEKAFDRVSHLYLFKLLERFGFSSDFVEIIKLFYTDTSEVKVNMGLTNKFSVKSGVRQGCPLSMSLFILCMEPLIQMVNKCNQMRGCFLTGDNPIKILCYADDTTFVMRDLKEYHLMLKLFDIFSAASNAKINNEKMEILS